MDDRFNGKVGRNELNDWSKYLWPCLLFVLWCEKTKWQCGI